MQSDIEHFVKNVCSCLKQRKPQIQLKAPLQPIITTFPSQKVCVDFLHVEESKSGYEYILVVMDHFTRFAQV